MLMTYLMKEGTLVSQQSSLSHQGPPILPTQNHGWGLTNASGGVGQFIEGLANKKTEYSAYRQRLVTKTRNQNKPASLVHKSIMRKEFPRMAKAVTNQGTNQQAQHANVNMVSSFQYFNFTAHSNK
ncbi:hypothetical protein ABKV19_014746 [Rosa sericea]